MRLQSIKIKSFRCFNSDGQHIFLDELTCFVGPNASGKTATMVALVRMFGETQRQRTVVPSDFHLAPGEALNDADQRHISLEVRLEFPELDSAGAIGASVPESFNQMVVDAPGSTPYCRMRLEATWTNDGTPTGDVQQTLLWLLTASEDPAVEANHKRRVKPVERARIRVVYVPATRDPAQQIRGTAATTFGQLLRALDWAGQDDDIRDRLKELNTKLGSLPGIGTLNENVQASWEQFYDGRTAKTVSFEPVNTDPSSLLRMLVPVFAPGEIDQQLQSEELSDGLRSLFALSLPLGLFFVEEALKQGAKAAGFQPSVSQALPLLTLFALEEPENHLSPHYLGRIIRQLEVVAKKPTAQVALSSHSPSIMARIKPDLVRYFLGGEARASTQVRTLVLPDDDADEAFKYVREAIRGYPELYFSRVIVLGEGPSEEIVLRRVLEDSGTPLDTHFISVVPLGGRHVNHFWRLLNGLGIPFLTLLDLDREKEGAGWGRIQYVREQLTLLHGKPPSLPSADAMSLSDPSLNLKEMDDRRDLDKMQSHITLLQEQYNVFFSVPLDLDFSMLEAFLDTYKKQAPENGGPRLPKDPVDRSKAQQARMRTVLAADPSKAPSELGSTYTPEQVELFPWYKYLFSDRSKPVTHMRALIEIDGERLISKLPEPLRALISQARSLIQDNGIGAR